MSNPDNDAQLKDLLARAENLVRGVSKTPATEGQITVIAQILAELIDIVHAHIYRDDDPGQP